MSKISDAQIRFASRSGQEIPAADRARAGRLEAARRARVGDWSEEELEALLCGLPLDRSAASLSLKQACLGAGDMDRRLSLREASELLGMGGLEGAARRGELATLPGGAETTEARLGAWLISQETLPQANPAAALRMVFLCGLHAGRRHKA